MIRRIFRWHVRRVKRERVADICILKIIVPVILHAGRNGDFLFALFRPEPVGCRYAFVRLDFPRAVQREKTFAFLSVVRLFRTLFKRYVICTRRLDAYRLICFVIFFQHIFYSFANSKLFIANSVTSFLGRLIHFPRVKSGTTTGAPPSAID